MTFFTWRRAWSASNWTLFLLALAAAPAMLDGGFELELLSKVMIMSIFAASLQLLVGCTGLVSLGHAAFFVWARMPLPSLYRRRALRTSLQRWRSQVALRCCSP